MGSTARSFVCSVFLVGLGCAGSQRVQLYEGDKLPDDQVTVLYSNPQLEISIDRQYTLMAKDSAKLHRFELPPGNHAVEVRCLYPEGPSPQFAVLLDGDAGHVYKIRAQFGKNAAGVPNCKAKMFDITGQPGAEKLDSY